jgi:methylase of polypeptide subunit release factors
VVTREESDLQATYDQRYRPEVVAAGIAAEREAVGSDYGNNGFTTVAQAADLARHLELGTGDVLLDIGSGSGWPGLHLAKQTGCRVVLSDLTVPGMRNAVRRARTDGIARRTQALVASARHLPFRPESFDAIVHTDVLC